MSNIPKDTFLCILAVILCALLPIGVYHAIKYGCVPKEPKENVGAIHDTIRDTIREAYPVLVHDTIPRYEKVRVPVREDAPPLNPKLEDQFRDSTKMTPDSVDVILPITQKEYAGSNYRVWISGYNPMLDSIHVYSSTITRTIVKQPRWGLSVGVGASVGRKIEPCLFVGLTYTIKTF